MTQTTTPKHKKRKKHWKWWVACSGNKGIRYTTYILYHVLMAASAVFTAMASTQTTKPSEGFFSYCGYFGTYALLASSFTFILQKVHGHIIRTTRDEEQRQEKDELAQACKSILNETAKLMRQCVGQGEGIHNLKVTVFYRANGNGSDDPPVLKVLTRVGGHNDERPCNHEFPVSGTSCGIAGRAFISEEVVLVARLPEMSIDGKKPSNSEYEEYAKLTFVHTKAVKDEYKKKKEQDRRLPRSFWAAAIRSPADNTSAIGVVVVDCIQPDLDDHVRHPAVSNRLEALALSLYTPLQRWNNANE
jgi:hypothetical protein